MNKKVKIALWCLFAAVSVALVVLYIIFPDQTTYYFNCVKDFINRPLPIVGVSLVVVMIFIYKILVKTRFGKKVINELKEKIDLLHREHEEYKAHVDEKAEETRKYMEMLEEQLKLLKEQLDKACELSSNIKIKGLVNNEKAVDGDTEEK